MTRRPPHGRRAWPAGGATAAPRRDAGGATVAPRRDAGGATAAPRRDAGGATVAPCRDAGGASVWLLAVGMVLLAAGFAGMSLGAAHVAAHQARTAADLGALAGAARAGHGPGVACDRARAVVVANDARLVACEAVGLDLIVTVEVAPATGTAVTRPARATSRAGPVRADDSRTAPAA